MFWTTLSFSQKADVLNRRRENLTRLSLTKLTISIEFLLGPTKLTISIECLLGPHARASFTRVDKWQARQLIGWMSGSLTHGPRRMRYRTKK